MVPEGRAWNVAMGRMPWVVQESGRVQLRNDPVGRRVALGSTAGAWNDPLERTWATPVVEAAEVVASD